MKTAIIAAVAAATAAVSPAMAATPFDLESTPRGQYEFVKVADGSLTMTITSQVPNGVVAIDDTRIPSIGNGALSYFFEPFGYARIRFGFDKAIDSITFNYGDNGGDDDGEVSVAAYDAGDALLGTVYGLYPAGERLGRSLTANFLGASYYVVGSTGVIPNSMYWDVSAITAAASAGGVPEPATWALMILGIGAVGGAMRRRAGKAVAVAA